MNVQHKLRMILEGNYETEGFVLHEAYYGTNPQLLKCEELFAAALESSSGDNEIKQIQNILQKQFNFKKLVISTFPMTLAGTIPFTMYKFKYAKTGIQLERSSTGLRFKTEDEIEAVMFLDLNLLKMCNITPKEGIAIILHEIGHSMQGILPSERMGNAIGALNFASKIIPMIMMSLQSQHASMADGYEEMDKTYVYIRDMLGRRKRDVQVAIRSTIMKLEQLGFNIKSIYKLWEAIKDNVWKGIHDIIFGDESIGGVIQKINMSFALMRMPAGYKAESFADHIATVYGYGPYITSGLGKVMNKFNTFGINNAFLRLIKLPFTIAGKVLDPHPNDLTRFKDIIKDLERELEKETNKEAYDVIKKDIEAAKQGLNDFVTELEKHKLRNFDIIIYKRIMGWLMDGNDDIKGLFFNLKPKDIEYLDQLEKSK